MQAVKLLAAAWPQPMPPEAIAVYVEMLSDIPDDELAAAVRSLIGSEEWRPPVARIRRAVVEAREQLPAPAEATAGYEALEAWAQRSSVAWGAQPAPPEQPAVHPTVLAAWETVGSGAYPATFARAWRAERDAWIAERVAGPLDQQALTTGEVAP